MWLVPFLWQLWSETVMSVHRPSGQWTPTTSPTHLHSRCPPLVPWWKILTLPGLQIRWVWSGCGLDTHACSRGEFTVTTTVWMGTAVRGVTAFILTHVLVDQVSLVRVWLGHACLLKGYIHCNRHYLDMYSCSGCDHFHPDIYTCGSGESVSSRCVHHHLDMLTCESKNSQFRISTFSSLTQVPVDQVTLSIRF